MPKTIEKLTPYEKAHISRQMILKWHRAKRKEKLLGIQQELREAYKAGKSAELAALRQSVIENTKRDLKRLKKMSDKEAEKKATEFADQFIKVAKGEADIESILKIQARFAVTNEIGDEIIQNWHKIERKPVEDNFKYEFLREFTTDPKMAKEGFVLFGLIEKYWSKKEALKQYKKCVYTKSTTRYFDLTKLQKFFSRKNTEGKIGFWYGTRVIYWDPKGIDLRGSDESWKSIRGFSKEEQRSKYVKRFLQYKVGVKGWWAHDANEREASNYFDDIGTNFEKDILGKLRKGDRGDEWLGRDIFEAHAGIDNELSAPHSDSGCGKEKDSEVLAAYKKLVEESHFTKKKTGQEFVKWFRQKKRAGKWVSLSERQNGLLNFLGYSGCGSYLYRYEIAQKRIYFLGKKGRRVTHVGYFEVKSKKIGKKGTSELGEMIYYDKKAYQKGLKRDLIDKMDPKKLKEEAIDLKIKQGKGLPASITLKGTKGLCYKIRKIRNHKKFKYEDLNSEDGYLDILETAIIGYLKSKGWEVVKARELAAVRRVYVDQEINKQIKKGNEILKEVLEENPSEKIKISINSKDEVTVKLASMKRYNDLVKERYDEVEDVVTGTKDLVNSAWEKFEKKVGGPMIAWILDKVLGIKKGLTKIYEGGSSIIIKTIFGFLGMGGVFAAKSRLGASKMDQERFEKLLKPRKKRKTIRRKLYFSNDVKLKGYKIVIPSGRGIKPGKAFQAEVKGKGKVMLKPEKKKEEKGKKKFKFSLSGLFGLFKKAGTKEEFLYKNKKITIHDGTTIPKGTIIPRGAKIYRTKKSKK